MMSLSRVLLRSLPLYIRRWIRRVYYKCILAAPDRSGRGAADGSRIVVAGMFSTASGLGEWARSTYDSLINAGYDVIAVDLSPVLAPMDYACEIPLEAFPSEATGTLILHANAPEVPTCLATLGLKRGRSWRVIAAWAWELDVFPPNWDHAYPFISEIWALSDFAAKALLKHPNSPPVRVLPIAIRPMALAAREGKRPAGVRFTVLVLADALSSLSRKNPMGAIDAFRLAFGSDEGCRLVIKVRNLDPESRDAQQLVAAATEATNIDLLDQTLSKAEHVQLIASADVLVSLHRAEGFGLGLAEAMVCGVPVIATGWSGNLTFCDAKSTSLIEYNLIPVSDAAGPYSIPGALWADPNLKVAADALTRLRDDRSHAEILAAQGMAKIHATCGKDKIMALILEYLRSPISRY